MDAIAVRFYDENTDGDLLDANEGAHYYLQDANFNVTAVTDNTGAVKERYAYTPYGDATFLDASFVARTTQVSDISNEYLYTGRRLDPETGLQLNRNRFYVSNLGRWVNRDPIGYWGGYNLYQYVDSTPLRGLDPYGLQRVAGPAGIVGPGLGGGAGGAGGAGGGGGGAGLGGSCPEKGPKPCDKERFLRERWRAGFDAHGVGLGRPNGPGADGKLVNALAHCLAACRIRVNMPECDYDWERSEWEDGKPRDFNSDLDIRNNRIGRDIGDAFGRDDHCWLGCKAAADKGMLSCDDGTGRAVPCPPYN